MLDLCGVGPDTAPDPPCEIAHIGEWSVCMIQEARGVCCQWGAGRKEPPERPSSNAAVVYVALAGLPVAVAFCCLAFSFGFLQVSRGG